MSSIVFEKIDNLGVIKLNRPDKLNSFNREMAFAMQSSLDKCEQDPEIRAVLIVGEGRAFCAGQDLEEAISDKGPGLRTIVEEHYNPIIVRIREMEMPVVAAVNGVAAGAGANLALACDIVVTSEVASVIQAFSAIGLVPDSGGTYTLPRLVGWQKASALMMLGDKVKAHEAEKLGMVYKVFGKDDFEEESMALATRLSTMATQGLALTKKALNASLTNTLEEQLNEELELQTLAGQTHDYQEGVNSFLEKRRPNFKGE